MNAHLTDPRNSRVKTTVLSLSRTSGSHHMKEFKTETETDNSKIGTFAGNFRSVTSSVFFFLATKGGRDQSLLVCFWRELLLLARKGTEPPEKKTY
jgi:hypothetical protein